MNDNGCLGSIYMKDLNAGQHDNHIAVHLICADNALGEACDTLFAFSFA